MAAMLVHGRFLFEKIMLGCREAKKKSLKPQRV
jgi:hypothetical protein